MKDLRSIYALPILRLGSRAKDRAADCLPARNRGGRPIFPAAAERQEEGDLVGRKLRFRLGQRRFGLGKRALGVEHDLEGIAPRLEAKPGDPGGLGALRPRAAQRGDTVELLGIAGEGALRFLQRAQPRTVRSEEHTSELQSLMRISYAVFCL